MGDIYPSTSGKKWTIKEKEKRLELGSFNPGDCLHEPSDMGSH